MFKAWSMPGGFSLGCGASPWWRFGGLHGMLRMGVLHNIIGIHKGVYNGQCLGLPVEIWGMGNGARWG